MFRLNTLSIHTAYDTNADTAYVILIREQIERRFCLVGEAITQLIHPGCVRDYPYARTKSFSHAGNVSVSRVDAPVLSSTESSVACNGVAGITSPSAHCGVTARRAHTYLSPSQIRRQQIATAHILNGSRSSGSSCKLSRLRPPVLLAVAKFAILTAKCPSRQGPYAQYRHMGRQALTLLLVYR